MSPEPQQSNSGNANAEVAFVEEAREQPPTGSERSFRIIVGVLAILAVVTFIWMHVHLFLPENLGEL